MTMASAVAETADGYRVDIARGVGEIDREQWNAVVLGGGGSIFHSWEWLAAFEEAPPGEFEPAHVVAFSGNEVVGVCPAYLVHSCPRLDYLWSLSGISPSGPILLAHSLAAFAGGPLALHRDPHVLDLLVDGMRLAADQLGAAAWGFANLRRGPLVGRLLGAGHAVAQVTAAHRLTMSFRSNEDYWASIPSARRRKLQRERRLRLEHSTVTDGMPDTDTFVRLVHSLLADRSTPVDVLPRPFLEAVRRHLAPYERGVIANRDDTTVALFAGWQFGGEWSAWIAGLDTDALSSFEPYHPMLAHTIESAIGSGTAVVDFGRANALQKRRYGMEAVPLYLTLHASDPREAASLHAACLRIEEELRGAGDVVGVVRRCC